MLPPTSPSQEILRAEIEAVRSGSDSNYRYDPVMSPFDNTIIP
jgi:hypothetical protein